jgi:hypothetical protein
VAVASQREKPLRKPNCKKQIETLLALQIALELTAAAKNISQILKKLELSRQKISRHSQS